jgi:hypothetical protein
MEKIIPVLFVGHGSPMNAIEDNEFTGSWKEISKKFRNLKQYWQYLHTMRERVPLLLQVRRLKQSTIFTGSHRNYMTGNMIVQVQRS